MPNPPVRRAGPRAPGRADADPEGRGSQPPHVRTTLEAGADGYVLKDDTRDNLLKALRAARNGKVFLSPGICGGVVMGYLSGRAPGPETPSPQSSWSKLTARERQMLKLVAG